MGFCSFSCLAPIMMGFSSNCHYVSSAKVPPLNLRTTYSTQCLWQEISHFPEPSNFCSNVIYGRVGGAYRWNESTKLCVCVCACFILAIFLCRDCLWTVQIFSAWRKDKINYTSNSVNWFAWVIYNSSKHPYWSGGGLQAFFFLKNSYSSLAAAPTGHWLCLGYAVMPADSPVETRCKSVTWYELTVVWMSCVNNWSISSHYFFSKS